MIQATFVNKMLRKKTGFTLIELLVVIMIIAIIATIVVTITVRGRVDARNAKRRADLDAIKTAVELYYQKFGTYIIMAPDAFGQNTVPTGKWPQDTQLSIFNCASEGGHQPVSIASALEQWGFLNPAPIPPGFNKNDHSGDSEDVCQPYLVAPPYTIIYPGASASPYVTYEPEVTYRRMYRQTGYWYRADKNHFSIYAGLERPEYDKTIEQEFVMQRGISGMTVIHPDSYCNGLPAMADSNPGDLIDDGDDNDSENCHQDPSAPGTRCFCHCNWVRGSTSGSCADGNLGDYISRWTNYRIGNGM